MRHNRKAPGARTHEGGPSVPIKETYLLRKLVATCLLWESKFYVDGFEVADLIATVAASRPAEEVAALAVEARTDMKLRHVPLWLAVGLAEQRKLKAQTLVDIIRRPDEMGEFLSLYWRNGRKPIAAQIKKGLARAFVKFDAYQLSKWTREKDAIKPRDIMFLTHPKPVGGVKGYTKEARKRGERMTDDRDAGHYLFRQVAERTLDPPDTWETNLSAGKDKLGTWLRLIESRKLGLQATIMNLRNMKEAGVDKELVKLYLEEFPAQRIPVLPFRFIAAANAVPEWEDAIEPTMFRLVADLPKLPGKTAIVVDVSGSMFPGFFQPGLSGKSTMAPVDNAAALAILAREICEHSRVFCFANECVEIAPRRGFALRDAILRAPSGGTFLGRALEFVRRNLAPQVFDRVIVITDEQVHDSVGEVPGRRGYMINPVGYKRSVGFGKWTHIAGMSEKVLDFVREVEALGG